MIIRLAWFVALFLIPVSTATASTVFDGRNFGTIDAVYPDSINVTTDPALAPWSYIQNDKAPNTGNKATVVTSPVRRAGGESAQIDLVPTPAGTSERVQYRSMPVGGVENVEGQDWWYGMSLYFPKDGGIGQDFNSFLDVGTKFNAECAGSAGQGGSQGAAVPELYYHTPTNQWYLKLAGGSGPAVPLSCAIRTLPLPLTGVPRDVWVDWLLHFKYSSTAGGSPSSEAFVRVGPEQAWTQADLDPKGAGLADTQPNLVARQPYPAAIQMHYGFYKPDEAQDVTLRNFLGGLVVATTRAEAEGAF